METTTARESAKRKEKKAKGIGHSSSTTRIDLLPYPPFKSLLHPEEDGNQRQQPVRYG